MYVKGKRVGKPTAAGEVLVTSADGTDLLGHHCRMKIMEQKLCSLLAAELRELVKVADFRNGKLSVFCADAASASSFRYATREYLTKLSREEIFQGLHSIKVRVKIK